MLKSTGIAANMIQIRYLLKQNRSLCMLLFIHKCIEFETFQNLYINGNGFNLFCVTSVCACVCVCEMRTRFC